MDPEPIRADQPAILLVDDRRENLYALRKLLECLNVHLVEAASGEEALGLVLEHDFSLAIVDVQMPEMDGYELVELLRGNESTATLPVIFVSAIYSDEYHHHKGYDAGAVDFLSKPFKPEILLSKVRVFIDLHHQRIHLRQLVDKLNQANQELQAHARQLSEINASKDRFFSIISHDLATPFNALIGNTQLMVKRFDSLDRQALHDMARSIYTSSKAAYDLLQNLLTWSRLQRGILLYRPQHVILSQQADQTLALLASAAQAKDIHLDNQISLASSVYADTDMLNVVIRNLVSNAIKFTPAGGLVNLTASPIVDGYIQVSIADNGVGIKAENLEKLFRIDIAHTTPGTEDEGGTGLGLIICQEMVEKNRGKLWIESQPGAGTIVHFTIPADQVK